MRVESIYAFNGARFTDHAHFEEFKVTVIARLGYIDLSAKSFSEFYENYAESKGSTAALNEILFENIMYGRLTNVFIHKIETPSTLGIDIFKKQAEKIIESFKGNVSTTAQAYMKSAEKFYLMDVLNVTTMGANFIAGFDYKQSGNHVTNVRFLVGRTVMLKRKKTSYPGYLLAAVELDFERRICIVMTKHTSDVEIDDGDESIKSPSGYRNFILDKFVSPFSIKIGKNVKKDREGMFAFCYSLYEKLISDVREVVRSSAQQDIDATTRKLEKALKRLGSKPSRDQIGDLSKNIHNLLLGIHIENNIPDEVMAQKAADAGLIGYPTNIDYQNNRMNRSSTGTGQKGKPICKTENLYSLLTDFEKAQKLNKWNLSWFRDPNNPDVDKMEQTRIESMTDCLYLRFKGKKHLGKELIQHVVGNLDQHRGY
ncbi:hypothetical protein [Paenibacillus abyssi]|uniref:Uncharacterized protein n=1 Tax=Paenibacillus abyssi TaxID=1340531 RepID=A0A917D0T2_9BACL|nr:hypothetical protein [Paenibacillus abyssi]GGG07512.1 hypothetical protein GCM10010916_25520 [Paenibacillus abyssi]